MPTYQEQQRQQVENRTNQQGDQVATARPTAVDQVKTYLESCPTAASTARYVKQLQAQGLLNEAGLAKVRDLIQHTCGNDYAKEVAFHLNNKSRQALPGDFEAMWEAHPHNYQEDPAENTSSDEVHEELGWKAGTYENTCAMRLSVMFNKLGGEYKIDRTKVEKAGIPKHRAFYSKATNTYLLLSAKEMWTYVSYWFGKAHKEFPEGKRFKSDAEFQTAWTTEIQPYIASRKGIVAFDKIFGYGGTGHVDIFNGENLSDAPGWYACQNLKLWFV